MRPCSNAAKPMLHGQCSVLALLQKTCSIQLITCLEVKNLLVSFAPTVQLPTHRTRVDCSSWLACKQTADGCSAALLGLSVALSWVGFLGLILPHCLCCGCTKVLHVIMVGLELWLLTHMGHCKDGFMSARYYNFNVGSSTVILHFYIGPISSCCVLYTVQCTC